MQAKTMTPITYYKDQLYDLVHHHTNIGNVIASWIGDENFDTEYMHPQCAKNARFSEVAFHPSDDELSEGLLIQYTPGIGLRFFYVKEITEKILKEITEDEQRLLTDVMFALLRYSKPEGETNE